jgi:hypothetical protein
MPTIEPVNLPSVFFEFLQVALFAIGMFFIFKLIWQKNKMCGNLALFGGMFSILGGGLKVFGLFVKVLSGEDKPFFINSLLVFYSAGLICTAFALYKSQRRDEAMNLSQVWTVPVLLVAIVWAISGYSGFFTGNRDWLFILLAVTVSANTVLLLQLILRSLKPKPDWIAAGLFIANLIVIFALVGDNNQGFLYRLKTMLGQGSFAAASWLLLKKES